METKNKNIKTFSAHLDKRYGKIGAKKSFISKIENGHSDIQLSTLYKLIELGLGRTTIWYLVKNI